MYARIGRKLIHGLRYPTIVRGDAALWTFDIRPERAGQAIADALRNEDEETAAIRWTDALSSWRAVAPCGVGFGSHLVDARAAVSPIYPGRVFAAPQRIGGRRGWYHDTHRIVRMVMDLGRHRHFGGRAGRAAGTARPDRPSDGKTLGCCRVEVMILLIAFGRTPK